MPEDIPEPTIQTALVNTNYYQLPGDRYILHLELHRPEAINALNLEMVAAMLESLRNHQNDSRLFAVYLSGQGDRGFCAGGDIRMFYGSAKETDAPGELALRFFQVEYTLDLLLAEYPCPVICQANGIVMGGGLGLLWASDYRLLYQDSVLAMPEIGIGLYPDAGGSYYLNQIQPELARFIALTAYQLNAREFSECGYDAVFVDSARDDIFSGISAELSSAENDSAKEVLDKVFSGLACEFDQSSVFETQASLISSLFASSDIFDIHRQLEGQKNGSIAEVLAPYFAGSPLSAWLICQQLERCRGLSLQQVLQHEMVFSKTCLLHGDLVEGVRALAIDKDKSPRWMFDNLEQIATSMPDNFSG